MATLIRARDANVLDTLPGIQQAILDHRQQPMTIAQANAFMNAVEVVLNSIFPLEHVPMPTLENDQIRELQDRFREAEQSLVIAESVADNLRQQLTASRTIQLALAATSPATPTTAAKIPDLEMYSGDKEKIRAFSVQLRLKTQTITDEQA